MPPASKRCCRSRHSTPTRHSPATSTSTAPWPTTRSALLTPPVILRAWACAATSRTSPSARAIALLRGRKYALPHDVFDIAKDVLRHRMVLSYQALAESVTPDKILDAVL